MSMTGEPAYRTDTAEARADRKLNEIREILAVSDQSAEDLLDRISDIVGERRAPQIYQKALG